MGTFRAFIAEEIDDGIVTELKTFAEDVLTEGNVLIEVHYSSVNYKDALAAKKGTGVVRHYPMILGIDLSGIVIESESPDFKIGDPVIVTGQKTGTGHYGGFSELARIPSEWIVALPDGLSLKEAMIIGTAGFTAAQSIRALEEHGVTPEKGEVLVTGATGGVGSMAVAMLAKKGYQIAAASRKKEEAADYLQHLGAQTILHSSETELEKPKPLAKQRWSGIVNPVGGKETGGLLAQLQYGGSMALSGNAGGIKFDSTVLPFILRNIQLLGIDSVSYPLERRKELWERLAADLKPADLEQMIDQELSLQDLPNAMTKILDGKMKGRTLVKIK